MTAVRMRQPPKPYRYRALGQVATLGRYKGVAEVFGLRFSGFPGWFITRAYHLYAIPLATRQVRVLSDWILSLLFKRDVVSFGVLDVPPPLTGQSPGTTAR